VQEQELNGVVRVSVPVKNFLRNRRDRAVGSILGYAESHIKPKLRPDEWMALRQVVLDATNSYHDTVLDLVKSEDGTVRNDRLVEILEQVDRQLRANKRTETHV
jgi:hypothetical protein